MRKIFIIALLVCSVIGAADFHPDEIASSWMGAIETGGIQLRMVVNFERDAAGNLTATFDSPDQGANGIVFDEVAFHGDTLILKNNPMRAFYTGLLAENRDSITGQWHQSGMSLSLNLKPQETAIETGRPQDPQPPFPYLSEDVTFKNKEASITLAGTLTLPDSDGSHPAVVLISGSGSQNRNEEIFNHRPFLVLADFLTQEGIAVLRYDDRGIGGSGGDPMTATSEDYATDTYAAVQYLKTRPEINGGQIGLIGHSEGGIIGPMVAADYPDDVAFVIMMAGTGLTGEKIILEQIALLSKAQNVPAVQLSQNLDASRKIFKLLRQETDEEKLEHKVREIIQKNIANLSPDEKGQIADTLVYVDNQIRQVTLPWTKYFLSYDPVGTLKKVKCPVLAVFGSLDLQVSALSNQPAIEKALKEGGNKDYSFHVFEGLNHLFQTADTGMPTEYGAIDETIAPDVMLYLADWILARADVKR